MKLLICFVAMIVIYGCSSDVNETTDMDLSNQSFKEKLVSQLVELTIVQRQKLYDIGAFDGTGLLYQSTEAYQLLLNICSDEELSILHQKLYPEAPYIPYKERIISKLPE